MVSADGIQRGSFCFDDHAAVWVRTILDTALRPRRGGPRFVDPTEKAAAETLVADPRTNDQLAYDLLIDVLRAGALADAKTVFGTKQAGIRILITQDTRNTAAEGRPAVGLVEEDLTTLPGWLVAQHECDTGTMEWSVDRDGNPLYLGREARLLIDTETRPRRPRRRMPVDRMRPARVVLRNPPHRPLRARRPHRRGPRDQPVSVPPHEPPPRRLADHPTRPRRLRPAPTRRREPDHPETPARPPIRLGRHRPTPTTIPTRRMTRPSDSAR